MSRSTTTGERTTFTGDIVVVSAGAANSALLLASASDRHPNGLANGSDQVGRNYMFHNSAAVLAISKEPNPTKFQKTLGVNDFYFGMPGFEFPMGNIQMVGKSTAPMFRGEKPIQTKLAPTFSLDEVAKHAVDFWLSTEDLPRPENRVTLDRDGNITLDLHAQQPGAEEAAVRQAQVDARPPGHAPRPPAAAHDLPQERHPDRGRRAPGRAPSASGPTRRPPSSTSNCKAHELDNLYVVDTSFFPSIGAVNPALTAMANALRVGDHLLERWAL